MKKHLIAAAVAAAVAVPAMAQNVTLYGILDLSYGQNETKKGGSASSRVKSTGLADTRNASSRIGFRGTEDLGGGLKAGFVLETGLNIVGNQSFNTGGTTKDVNGANVFSASTRQAFVTVGGGFGTVLAGYKKQLETDFNDKFYVSTDNSVGGQNYLLNRLTRANQIAYTLPKIGIMSVTAAYTPAKVDYEDAVTDKKKLVDAKIFSVNADFAINKDLTIGAHFGSGDVEVGTDGTALVSSSGVTSSVASGSLINFSAGAKNKYDTMGVGVNYVINGVRLAAMYGERETGAGATQEEAKYYNVGVAAPFGATTLKASYGYVEAKTSTAEVHEIAGFQLQADYALSKRTTAWALYGTDKDKKDSDLEKSVFAVGVTHSF